MVRNRAALLILIAFSLSSLKVLGQAVWEVRKKPTAIQVDGFLQEWDAVTGLTLQAGGPGVRTESVSQADDVSAVLKAAWDKDNLYVAL